VGQLGHQKLEKTIKISYGTPSFNLKKKFVSAKML
jgi:hypothetical protein